MDDGLKTKHIIFGLLLFIGGGYLVYQEYQKDESWTPPPSENKTVVVYGKVPRTYRRSACIEVVDINKHERFTICSEYCVQRMRGAYEGHYSSEVDWAERGDTLIVKSQGMGTWQIIKNVTAERLVNHSR